MTKKKLYKNAAKVQFWVEQELKNEFEKWCYESNKTMTDVFNQFMQETVKSK